MNRRTILALVLLLIQVQFASGQNEKTQAKGIFGSPIHDQVVASGKTKNDQQTVQLASALLNQYSDNSIPYYYIGKSLYFLKKNEEALKYLKVSGSLEPYNEELYYYLIMTAIVNYDVEAAKKAFHEYSFIYTNKYNGNLERFNGILDHYSGYESTKTMASQIRAEMARYEANYKEGIKFFYYNAATAYDVKSETFKEGKVPEAVDQLLALKPKMKEGYFPISIYNQILRNISYWAFSYSLKIGSQLLPELYEQFKDPKTSVMMRYKIYVEIAKINQSTRKYEDNIGISNIMLQELPSVALSNAPIVKVANFKIFALIQLSQYNEAAALAKEIQSFIPKLTDQEVRLESYYNSSRAIAYNGDKEKGIAIAEEGVAYAKEYGWEELELGGVILKTLNQLKGFNNEEHTIEADINSQDYLALYDGASEYIQIKDYPSAIPFLEKSKRIYEGQMAEASDYDRRSLLTFYAKVCGNLTACYQETKAFEKAFSTMEDVKANGLLEAREKKANLSEIQASLSGDEALIYYVDVSRGFTYEGIYLGAVITKESFNTRYIVGNGALMATYMVYNDLIGEIEEEMAQKEFRKPRYTKYEVLDPELTQLKEGEFTLLTELYRKHLIGQGAYDNPGYLNEFAKSFYQGFVAPLEGHFSGKKTLLFSLDGALNFLPFESFKNANGKYLIENYDVGYIPSGTVLREIRNRPARNYSKTVLAYGDAKYAKLSNPGRTLSSVADIDRISLEVKASLEKGEPLDYAYATFSKEAMNYLAGAKAEVEAISSMVPNTDLKMDDLMTENEFKRMSVAGELKDYQAIHLSSHATVHPYIFDLSGIAFSVFPTPKDGEDGMLTVNEMAKLKIETDFMMLSACQTGLGKLVPGEGVMGLNQSMLKAGANATLTSLWSVSDYGTSIFTVNLYKKIFSEGKSYIQAASEVKRSFIRGDYNGQLELSKPFFWSPFVYYGK